MSETVQVEAARIPDRNRLLQELLAQYVRRLQLGAHEIIFLQA